MVKAKIKIEQKLKTIPVIILFIIVCLVCIHPFVSPHKQPEEKKEKEKVRISIIGPKVLATSEQCGETAMYKIRIRGGPAEYANESRSWSYSAYLEGENTTEASPVLGSEAKGSSESSGNFTFNVTAPRNVEEKLTLVVNGTSTANNKSESAQERYPIVIVKPVVLTFEVYNKGKVDVQNIIVHFYVDEEYIGSKTISSLTANSSTSVSINWTIETYKVGKHIAKAKIVPESALVLFKNNKNVISKEFYIIGKKMDPKWFYIATALFIIISMILLYALFRKRPPTIPK